MKRRSVLNKQAVKKRKKKKKSLPVFGMIRTVVPVLLKCFVILATVAGLSISLMYCYHYLHHATFLRLEQVKVAGVDKEIQQDLKCMVDLNSYTNLLFLNLNELRQKMEKHPWVRSAKLDRQFPNTLFVQVEKHRPSAVVLTDAIYYMNQWCEIFKKVDDSDDIDFPVVTGISKNQQEARGQLNRVARVMEHLASEKGPWSLSGLSEIHIEHGEVSLYFNHLPAEINIKCDGLPGKMEGLRKVTKHLRKTGRIRQVTGIDLNPVDGAVVSFRKG
jgi:cell division septal protein FtsQ